jgi:hypothetical protein
LNGTQADDFGFEQASLYRRKCIDIGGASPTSAASIIITAPRPGAK